MNVLIWTDLEGVGGIVDFDKHEPMTPKDMYQRELMTGELNAAIRACFDSGAEKLKVVEGHDATYLPDLDHRALIVPARYPAVPKLQDWRGYDYMILIGCHSMAGTSDGVLSHTGNRNVKHRKINGKTIGEIGTAVLEAGEYGIKVIMASGDRAACREAKEFCHWIETAQVKVGYDSFHAECMHPVKARELIYKKVKKAFENKGEAEIKKPEGKVVFEEKYYTDEHLKDRKEGPHMEIVNPYTVRYFGDTLEEAYGRRCGLDL